MDVSSLKMSPAYQDVVSGATTHHSRGVVQADTGTPLILKNAAMVG